MKKIACLAYAALAAFSVTTAPASPLRISGEAAAASTKSAVAASFRQAQPASLTELRLAPLDTEARARLEARVSEDGKRVRIGIARSAPRSADLQWQPIPGGGHAARITVTSPEAGALRVGLRVRQLPAGAELRFRGTAAVIGPLSAATVLEAARRDGVFWTPVTEGDTQTIELWLPQGVSPAGARVTIDAASHLDAGPTTRFTPRAKATAAGCHEDVACVSGTNEAIAKAARSVAKMVFTENGATYTCSGTLLNDSEAASQVPYLYTAAHCIDSQAAAATLNTFWFFEAASCGAKTAGAYAQLTGGATLLHANPATDAALLRLADRAPDGAWFAGWDAAPLAEGAAVVGIHHPQGDLKKLAMGKARVATPGDGGASYATASWIAGSTESGSSGSGLFTLAGNEYVLRGGLKGGSASCSSSGRLEDPANRDYYSRLDLEAQTLRTWLSAAAAPLDDYTDMWWNPSEPGWGLSIVQHASNKVFVAWYAYDRNGQPQWMVVPDAVWRSAYAFEGTLYRTSGPSSEAAYEASKFAAAPSGSMRVEFGHGDDATVHITVDGRSFSKPLRRQAY